MLLTSSATPVLARMAPHLRQLRDAFLSPRASDDDLTHAYGEIVREDQEFRGHPYTAKDHVERLNDLVWPQRVRIVPKSDLRAALDDAETLGVYDESREEAELDTFDPHQHFVVVDTFSPLERLSVPGAVQITPFTKLCILYWNE